jgi:hypothetical protein
LEGARAELTSTAEQLAAQCQDALSLSEACNRLEQENATARAAVARLTSAASGLLEAWNGPQWRRTEAVEKAMDALAMAVKDGPPVPPAPGRFGARRVQRLLGTAAAWLGERHRRQVLASLGVPQKWPDKHPLTSTEQVDWMANHLPRLLAAGRKALEGLPSGSAAWLKEELGRWPELAAPGEDPPYDG